jgi:nucleotide-binding universal stress UspA family protein
MPATATDPDERLVLLVPVDFSAPSRLALAWAFDYAQRAACEVHTLHVVDRGLRSLSTRGDLPALERELAQVHQAAAAELAAMVRGEEGRAAIGTLHEHVATGKPDEEILALVDELEADMVVLGTHGHTGVARLLLGSTAEKVSRNAPCTVVIVKPKVS